MFSVAAVQWHDLPRTKQSILLSVSSNSQGHGCMPLLEAVRYAQTDFPCLLFQHPHTAPLWFSLLGQYWECFTSSRLSWDANGLGLSLDMLLAGTLSSCKWTINSRMGTSRKVLWVTLPPHDLLTRNMSRMVMSVRWKKQFLSPLPSSLGSSVAVHHSVWLVHKPHVSTVVFYCTRFDSMALSIGKIVFNRRNVHACESGHITPVFPASSP
jgi:hypothetical protein